MKKVFLILVSGLLLVSVYAQQPPDCYGLYHRKGVEAYNAGNYEKAKEYFAGALSNCPASERPKNNDIDSWLKKCDQAIAAEKERQRLEQERLAQEKKEREAAAAEKERQRLERQRLAQEKKEREAAAEKERQRLEREKRTSAQQRHPVEPEMVKVEGGTFVMGCTSEQGDDCDDDEKPAHNVTLSSFQIGKYEVTQAQWKAVMETTVRQQRDKAGPDESLYGEGDNYPMYYVSWNEAQEFISRLNKATGKRYRLPTEAEWEYAARGGARSKGYKYSGSNNLDEVAWFYYDNAKLQTHPVGSKKANELGIHDMSGNVCEWCQDRYGAYSASSQQNPKGANDGSYRVYRGGGWSHYAFNCRVAFRYSYSPGDRHGNLGFRVVLP
jgi:formylglycine-generating enzyme required for sulfatase activity